MTDDRMMSPILWKIESERHFGDLGSVHKKDVAWNKKKPEAVWLGVMTGHPFDDNDDDKEISPLDRCKRNQRCNFVLQHCDSKLVTAGLTSTMGRLPDDDNSSVDLLRPSNVSFSRHLLKKPLSMKDMLKYKIIVSFEGNDVASGLKWNLLSNSVVLMPPPTLTTWAMEEYLQPWVHYIPIFPNGSNTEDMVQWVRQNDETARTIAERGALFMKDLVGDPKNTLDSVSMRVEEISIQREIRRRYYQLWHDDRNK